MKRGNYLVYLLIGVLAASVLGITTDQILQNVYDSVNTALRANIVAGSAGGSPAGSVGNLQTKASSSAFGAYGGTGACGAGTAVTALDASGAATCTAFGSGAAGTTTGAIQLKSSTTAFAADDNLVIDATNHRISGASLTSATDNTANMVKWSGTMPTIPTATVYGLNEQITGAGSASFLNEAHRIDYLAGYTGSSATRGLSVTNANVGTGATPNLGSTTAPVGNLGTYSLASAAGAGITYGVFGDATGSTGGSFGVVGRSAGAVAGTNIGVLGSAANSTEATNRKNVGGYFTLSSTDPTGLTGNGDRGLEVEAGTLPDSNSLAFQVVATLPSSPSGTAVGAQLANITSAGSAAQVQRAASIGLSAGYTGTLETMGLQSTNVALGTGVCGLSSNTSTGYGGACSPSNSAGNIVIGAQETGAGAGENFAIFGEARGSTTASIGVMGKSVDAVAGTNFGVIGVASNSSEGTNWKNIGGLFSVGNSTDLANVADNSSAALVAMSDGTVDIFRGYSTGSTKIISITTAGNISTGGTIVSTRTNDIGWSVQSAANQACNTTCTNACVFGMDTGSTTNSLLACTDATADLCLCAGAS